MQHKIAGSHAVRLVVLGVEMLPIGCAASCVEADLKIL